MIDSKVLAFAGVALVLTLTPGADTMLIIRNVLAYGRRDGFLTLIGIVSGLFVHATLSALGLSVILMRSAEAFEVAKLIGSCYLIFLGAQSIWKLIKHRGEAGKDAPTIALPPEPRKWWRSYSQGMLSNVLNPKVAIFYLAFLPQFVNPGDPVLAKSLLLAGIHLLEGVVWLSIVTLFIGQMKALFSRPAVQRGLEATAGAILIGLGLRLAAERR